MKNPKVSVIIPNYNHADYLKLRIDSVLNQSYINFEVIILDDFSTDISKDIIEQYRNHEKVVKILYNDFNSGSTFCQWQKGIDLASGDLIWIAESDDIANQKFLENGVKQFQFKKNLGIYFCQSIIIDHYNNEVNLALTGNAFKNSFYLNGLDFIKLYMINGNSVYNASAVLFSNNLVRLNSIKVQSHFKLCGDYFFWVEILSKSSIYYNSIPQSYFRDNLLGVTRRIGFANSIDESFEVIQKISMVLENYNLSKNKEAILFRAINSYSTINIFILYLSLKKFSKYFSLFLLSFIINYLKSMKMRFLNYKNKREIL
jgi:glycosyltransferase involved in cell wall biosynthesis